MAYEPTADALAYAIHTGEKIRQHLVEINAFDAAAAMRDLLAVARNERDRRAEREQQP